MSAYSAGDLIYIINAGFVGGVAIVSLLAYRRHRISRLLDVALMFGLFAAGFTLTSKLLWPRWPWLVEWGVLFIFTVPYVIIRLASHFEQPQPWLEKLTIGVLPICWAAILIWGPTGEIDRVTGPIQVVFVSITLFLIPQVYLIRLFWSKAARTRGVTRWRLRFAAVGASAFSATYCLGYALDLGGYMLASTIVFNAFLTISTLSYYLAFATPGILRQLVQAEAFYAFVREATSTAPYLSKSQVRCRLCAAAVAAVDAEAALMLEHRAHLRTLAPWLPLTQDQPMNAIDAEGGLLEVAIRNRQTVSGPPEKFGDEIAAAAARHRAKQVLAVPLRAGHQLYALLVVFLRQEMLFPDDDSRLLQMLCEHASLTEALDRGLKEQHIMLEGMLHDLKKPITTILGQSDLILLGIAPDMKRTRELLETNGDLVVSRLQEFSPLLKHDPFENPLALTPTDLVGLVNEVAEMLQSGEFLVEAWPKSGCIVANVARDLVSRAVENLIVNAQKHGSSGRWASVRVLSQEGTVRVEVCDRGPGIPEHELMRIFDLNYRGERARGFNTPGSGIGLAFVAKVVERHGGRIRAENRPEGGARFWMELPTNLTSA